MTANETLALETETCSRCGGCGEYSYCEVYGKTCFKCRGKGRTLTKRAQVAALWMTEQNLIPAGQVTIGMRIKALGITITVRTIDVSTSKTLVAGEWVSCGLDIRGQTHGITVSPDYMVQLIRNREAQIEMLRAAIDLQNSLTKAGKPSKRERASA